MGHSDVWGPAGDKLMVIGLTGGIASGKTEVAREFAKLGAYVIDADQVAREVILPGSAAYDGLLQQFGEGILEDSRQINRATLAGIVFADAQKRQLVNNITHPAILAEILHRVTDFADKLGPGDVPTVIVDAALIVDVGASRVFDQLVVVTADEKVRLKRLVYQREMSEDEARSRISSQIPDSQRIEMADLVIENNGTLDQLRKTVGDVWREIERRSRSLYS